MGRTSFESLEVYQLAEQVADAVWEIVRTWDRLAVDTVGKQVIRAADGIGANIAEGTGRYTHRDNRRFIRMARGSLYEVKHWLRRAHARDLLANEDVDQLKPLIDELVPRLNAYLAAIDRMAKAGKNNQP